MATGVQYACGPETERFRPLPTIKGRVDIFRDTERITYTMLSGTWCVRCGFSDGDILSVSNTLPVRHGDIVLVNIREIDACMFARCTVRADGLLVLWRHQSEPSIVRPGSCGLFRVLGRVPLSADVKAFLNRLSHWQEGSFISCDLFAKALRKLESEALGISTQPNSDTIDLWSYVRSRRQPGRILNLQSRLPIKSNRQMGIKYWASGTRR